MFAFVPLPELGFLIILPEHAGNQRKKRPKMHKNFLLARSGKSCKEYSRNSGIKDPIHSSR
jgi:hypothetical protein